MTPLAVATFMALAMVGFNITLLVWLVVRFVYGFKWAVAVSSVLFALICYALIQICA